MNILFVEDNDIKFRVVERWLNERFPGNDLARAASYQSGVRAALKGGHDWVLLDMTLPVNDEQNGMLSREPLTFGGESVLREIARKKVKSRVIVVSQYKTFVRDESVVSFEQLRSELLAAYPDHVVDCIYLETGSMTWKVELEKYLQKS